MEDRFKFRVWDKEKEIFVKVPLTCDGELLSPLGDIYEIEQCTGLKDKNSNLIYEGDILQNEHVFFQEKPDNYIVGWCKAGFKLLYPKDYFDMDNPVDIFSVFADKCLIIGNIHENKELLKDE